MSRPWNVILPVWAVVIWAAGPGSAQEPPLADYFGFDGLEVIKIGRDAGPVLAADMNGDGRADLVVVNNSLSRIEIHYQKPGASPEDAIEAVPRVNEFPEHWRFRREPIAVTHRVTAVVAHDFDQDGLMDLIYGGEPSEIVFLRQRKPGMFEVVRKHRVKNLMAHRNGLDVVNVMGDERPELISLVAGSIMVWPMDGTILGEPLELAAGAFIMAFVCEDYNGDGITDLAGIILDDPAPVRMWFGEPVSSGRALGPQIRFEMPALREFEAVRLPGESAARIAVIEAASKMLLIYKVDARRIEQGPERDAALRVHSFPDAGNRQRDVAVVDVDGDSLLDLVSTDTEANALVVFRQTAGKGFERAESSPCLSDLRYLAGANVDDDPMAELFVLSKDEAVVGRCDVTADGVPFPRPLRISPGHTPVALSLVQLEDGPRAAVVVKQGREYAIDLIDMNGDRSSIDLGSQSRSPETILALDADQDGMTDLLLFTRDKPMTMLHAGEDGFQLVESKDMGQFGLVQAAQAENTAVFDIDGDGREELLIAESNFVRALRYERDPGDGVSAGWQVVEQINAHDSTSKLVSLAIREDRIIAADRENGRLIILSPEESGVSAPAARRWREVASLNVQGFEFSSIYAGAFAGDGPESILAVGDDGFAVIRMEGERVALEQLASWRTTEERRLQHELTVGDINSDGFTDMVSLDGGEQMCEIFTFTASRKMLYAAGFQVFESKIFSGGEPREYQPSQALIADLTGDGANDLILLAHDRVLLYPQAVESTSAD